MQRLGGRLELRDLRAMSLRDVPDGELWSLVCRCATAGEERVVPVADLALGYRRSAITPGQVVVAATLGLAPGDRTVGESTLSEIVKEGAEATLGTPIHI